MRITGNRLIDVAAASTTKNQTAVRTTAGQLSSGLRVTTPSDDPTAWLAAQRVKLRQALSQGSGAAAASSRDRLQVTDSSLGSIGDVISQVRALAVQGASDTYSADNRAGLGAEVAALFQTALASANVQDANGEFLLAGSASLTAPFDPNGVYHGDASVRAVPSNNASTLRAVTVAGSALTAANGVDVLPLLSRVATALSTNDMPTLLAALPELDTAVKQVALARSNGGAAMNAIDQATSARTVLEQNMSEAISKFVEVDTVSAASELAKASQSLEVSRSVTSHILAVLDPSTLSG
jgi:flagellar hook-associated protein 3 FlgL